MYGYFVNCLVIVQPQFLFEVNLRRKNSMYCSTSFAGWPFLLQRFCSWKGKSFDVLQLPTALHTWCFWGGWAAGFLLQCSLLLQLFLCCSFSYYLSYRFNFVCALWRMPLGLSEDPWGGVSWSNWVGEEGKKAVCAYSAQVALPCCMFFGISVVIVLVKIYFRKSPLMN